MSDESLWIFGYGSLVWRPAFSHLRRRPAFIDGFARRFWQGSPDHRGVPGQPGRVVTLLPNTHESVSREPGFRATRCWGTAYEVPAADPEGVLDGLDHRERGGYERLEIELFLSRDGADTVHDRDPVSAASRRSGDPLLDCVRGLVYIAQTHNENYLGPASVEEIARQVARARGPSGANPEYVFELARSLRGMGVADEHVFEVDRAVREALSCADPETST